jgi:choline dehydrogenase-like flavoprotein
VMPMVPRGNTNAPTIAIAERAADLICDRVPRAEGSIAAPEVVLQDLAVPLVAGPEGE